MWNSTFISNSASKRLIPVVYSTCSHCDDEYDSTFITDSTSKYIVSTFFLGVNV